MPNEFKSVDFGDGVRRYVKDETARQSVENVQTNLNSLGESVSELESGAAAQDATISNLSNSVQNLSGSMDAISTSISGINSTIQNLNQSMAELQEMVNNEVLTAFVPSQKTPLTYTGTAQTPEFNNYDITKMTISGDTSKTNAGTYTAVFTLKPNHRWADGTTDPKSVTWTIGRVSVTVPSPTGTYTYTGNAISLQLDNNYSADRMTLGGVTSRTDAGTYTATVTPTANYQWSDGTTTAKNIQWTIAKATGSCTLNKSSLSLNASTTSGTVTVTRPGNGTVTATSSNTQVATVSVSGTTVTVNAVGAGSATITIKVGAGTNYTAPADKSLTVNVSLPTADLSSNDFSTIAAVGAAGNGANYWSVGDNMPVTLNGKVGSRLTLTNQTLYMFIVHFNYKGQNGVYFQGFKTAKTGGIDVALCDFTGTNYTYTTDGTKCFNMNHWGNYNYGGWKACDLRYDILGSTEKAPSGYGSAKTTNSVGYDATSAAITNPVANTLMAALPADLRNNLKPITLMVDNKGNGSNVAANVTASVDYLPLPTEFNIQGARTYANQYEKDQQQQFSYYANGNSKVKKNHQSTGSAVLVWCSSPYYGSGISFCTVSTDGSAYFSNAGSSFGLAPFCRVA